MKHENFPKAKSIVEEIDKNKNILDDLCREGVYVKIMNSGCVILNIDADTTSEDGFKDNAFSFINGLKLYYKQKIVNLTAELEEL